MTNKQSAKDKIESLVTRFEDQYESYKQSEYNETLTRRDFIDPFFKTLGWDMDNEAGYAEAYREVIHEDKVKVSGATKAPDYSFRLGGGKRLFFVEAKKPSVSVKDDIHPAYQVRRYGWSAKMPISIITDFEEFSIYDCTKKPKPEDKAAVARIKYLSFRDYIKEFDFIWDTFSKEQVLKGSFDKFLISDTHKKGTATVDKDFLESLDRWRTYLAVNISWNNRTLDEDEINFVVQQTIDRIIFLRIAEDRSVEPYGTLKHAVKQGTLYQNLFELFQRADEKYNSGLFDFKKDKISRNVIIENKIIRTIINELYYPECPYEFSVLSVEILGSAYEQFLGKVIRITPAHHAKIEEKPEVRKAGGVYYTPQYIVDYIVKNTVGKLIEGKTPKEISKIKILDPACGSGSFLIGAFQFLLDYHKDYYSDKGKPSKGKKDNPLTPDGHLTTAEKKRILLNNIFGVDLDINAVEVTKLSLLIKCLEGETEASIQHQFKIWNERVLPSLENNIKDGNSLIDIDFYSSELDLGFEKKIKPFSWANSFPEINKQGGFDIVIGNPPYVRQELFLSQKDYFKSRYKVFHGMADLYSYFIEKGINLINENGIFGIIVANKWMKASYGSPLREWILRHNIISIIDFGDLPVFDNATTYPCILICSKKQNVKSSYVTTIKTLKFDSLEKYVIANQIKIDQKKLGIDEWNLSTNKEQTLLSKLKSTGVPLNKYVNGKIYRGVLTGFNEAFVIDSETKNKLIKEDKRAAEIIKPYLAGRDIKRYKKPVSDKYLIFTRRGINIDDFPSVRDHLEIYKKSLMPKPKNYIGEKWEGRKPGSYKWYEIQDSIEYYKEFEQPKIIYQVFQVSPCFIWDTGSFYCNNSIWIIPKNDKLLLAILNSPLGWYLISKFCTKIQNGYQLIYKYLEKIPIKCCDLTNIEEKKIHDEIVKMVDLRIGLEDELIEARIETKVNQLRSKINYCEEQINLNLYKLYHLEAEEIRLIEGK